MERLTLLRGDEGQRRTLANKNLYLNIKDLMKACQMLLRKPLESIQLEIIKICAQNCPNKPLKSCQKSGQNEAMKDLFSGMNLESGIKPKF